MQGLTNLVTIAQNVWAIVVAIAAIIYCIAMYIKRLKNLSDSDKFWVAVSCMKAEILSLMSAAEIDWKDFPKAGQIKRSQVISEIFQRYPILRERVSEEDIEKLIDMAINEMMDELNEVIRKNSQEGSTS